MTKHEFLSPDRKVQRTRFGQGREAVEVVVNMGQKEWRYKSEAYQEILLPPYGFLVAGPDFAAFLALNWNGLKYEKPALFTLRSLDGRPLRDSKQVRVYHGFGDNRIKVGKQIETVAKESVIAAR